MGKMKSVNACFEYLYILIILTGVGPRLLDTFTMQPAMNRNERNHELEFNLWRSDIQNLLMYVMVISRKTKADKHYMALILN